MNRHKLRESTFKLLFSLEGMDSNFSEEHIETSLQSLELEKEEDNKVIHDRIVNISKVLKEVDTYIEAAADRWTIDRIGKIELSVLRVAVYEIKYEEMPVSVAINEAVEIAKRYGEDQSSRFVNGVLGEIVKKLDQ